MIRLHLVNTQPSVEPQEPFERIAASHDGRTTILAGLNQLRGLVQITNGATALRFVRLRTSTATWYAWPGEHGEVEIVTSEQARSLPAYRLGRFFGHDGRGAASGLLGILSVEVYRAVGFGPAKVEKAQGGFTITRWTFSTDYIMKPRRSERNSIQKIREFVGEDGEYRRTVLHTMSARRVPQLRLMTFE